MMGALDDLLPGCQLEFGLLLEVDASADEATGAVGRPA